MPRLARKDLSASFYHVIVQGINKEYIFNKKEYINKYLYLLNKYREEHDIKIIAYCIMNNHAHLLIYAEKVEELSKFMGKLNTIYAKIYNAEENRVGYVFRNRYKSEGIYEAKYLLNCIKYIHRNPVEAGIVEEEKEYKYSSYNDYVNKKGIITKAVIELVFGTEKNYLEQFYTISETNNHFLDEEKDIEKSEEIINRFCEEKQVRLEQVIEDDELLISLVKEIKEKGRISIRKISVLLKVNRFKIIRRMKKK